MAIGTVKFFNTAKGFGFIIPEDGGKDIFVHKQALELAGISTLNQGQYLSFETERDARGAVKAAKLKQHSKECTPGVTTEGLATSLTDENTLERKTNHRSSPRVPLRASSRVRNADQTESIQSPKTQNKSIDWQRSYDRYCDLAQNAGNDTVMREHYWQYAEHFRRMINGSST
jgi:cold shock protein